MHWSDDLGVWLAGVAAVQCLLLVVVADVECQRLRGRKLRRLPAHVGHEYEQAEAAKLKEPREVDVAEAESPQPAVGVFHS